MKLLIVSPQPEHPPVDAFWVFRALSEELSRRGHAVDYFIESGHIKPGTVPSSRVANPNNLAGMGTFSRGFRLATQLNGVCRKRDYDFVLTAASAGWCLSAFRQWLLPSKTKVLSWHRGHTALQVEDPQDNDLHHDPALLDSHSSSPRPWRERLTRWAKQKALETQDGYFFSATEAPVRVLEDHPQTDSQKLLYLPNGVASHYYYPERHQRQESGESPSHLLMVGPWIPEYKSLAETFSRLQQNHPHLRLSIAKPGLQPEAVLADFSPEVRSAITILPHLDEAALVSTYQQHDIYLQPSPNEGGVPLSLLAAMASALPVVAHEAPGVRDVLTHYENGLLIPPRDSNALEQSITHLIESPDLVRTLGETAYDHVSRYYTWRQIGDIFEEKLFQILENRLPTTINPS